MKKYCNPQPFEVLPVERIQWKTRKPGRRPKASQELQAIQLEPTEAQKVARFNTTPYGWAIAFWLLSGLVVADHPQYWKAAIAAAAVLTVIFPKYMIWGAVVLCSAFYLTLKLLS